jgi:uncharacterized YccA/Bax inhibitor family protein
VIAVARSSNPVFSSKAFQDQVRAGKAADAMPTPQVSDLESMYAQAPVRPGAKNTMTINDVLNKMIVMAAGVLVGGVIGWMLLTNMAKTATSLGPLVAVTGIAAIAALVIGLVNQMKAKASPTLSIVYAVIEGFLLGVISAMFELIYSGIVLQAILGTARSCTPQGGLSSASPWSTGSSRWSPAAPSTCAPAGSVCWSASSVSPSAPST